jgi:hypothetical protein
VIEIAARGAVRGRTAARILEAIAEACDESIRFQHGSILTRRESRRAARATPTAEAVSGVVDAR